MKSQDPPNVKNLLNIPQLLQQGRELYEAGNFFKALTVWQQAAEAHQAQRDMLNQVSNISLACQQLGQLPQATTAIAESLRLLSSNGQEPQRSQVLA
ncbi:hypothetical protein H6G17_29410 [Chroococcidiopsis sp. FACHB-1243]|uniref:hypothetical protein n=1 Tax=Chroococcidiopsis sp. [FACHB-1243] TaxID=2692781 RepID=UPI00177EA08D|nr:hypothetical protein [Chroococcidiopsis sp. [FACHB-1243]]MBD2309560.1 hypothetical protein [Chroococcidiopsis sp. [FACHB-1243]]